MDLAETERESEWQAQFLLCTYRQLQWCKEQINPDNEMVETRTTNPSVKASSWTWDNG